jgi:Flp pilus assembly protein TadG
MPVPDPRAIAFVRAHDGQAAVELVALLPVIAALLAALWQAALAGHATWAASAAARAAARAHAIGADPRRAARDRLPGSLERDLRLKTTGAGEVELAVRVPRLPGMPALGHVSATARFEPQS